ncbi:MAG: ABC transporter ATP-binding protein [Verrucomicrobia bacterium]|nr:ABC transporter ATP-binding protein [Verrucomicrobiota bacterium]MCH8528634.1 ABC transporter ATP-binding protein/permease [Kiritimatiellia bacterium]
MMDLNKNETLLQFVRSEMRHLWGGVVIAIFRSFCVAPLPMMFGMMIDRFVPSGNVPGILATAWIFVALLLLHMYFSVTAARVIGTGVTEIIRDLRSLIFNRLQFLHFGYLDRSTSGRLLSKYAFDTQKVQDLTLMMLNQFLPTFCYGLTVMIIMLFVEWRLSLVIFLVMPMVALARKMFKQRLRKNNKLVRLAQERLTGSANEMISALRLVRSLGEEDKAENRLAFQNQQVAETRVGLINVSSVFGTYVFVSNQFVSLIVVAAGALMVIHGQMSIGVLFAFVAALPIIMQPFVMVTQFIEQYAMGQEAYSSIRELACNPYVEQWRGKVFPGKFRGGIEIKDIHFSYPGKEAQPVFEGLNLSIRPGESVALVGASGSGKSSIANLILGLYTLNGGRIEIDGIPQVDLDMRRFRRQCAIVLQENILLSGTVMDNIRFAKSEASDEEVIEAAEAANADEFIRNLPEGYQTVIGERGVSLSGGQKQRLSIARAILRNPRILILDEATSALDNESEALIQQALDRLSSGRTVITIAHRLTTIRNADRIIVLGNGKILEHGSYDELVAANGAFRAMVPD